MNTNGISDKCPDCGWNTMIGDADGGVMCYRPVEICGYHCTRTDLRLAAIEEKINEMLDAMQGYGAASDIDRL